MKLIYRTCDYCGQGTHTVRFDGAGYCSCECASQAEISRRRAGRELRARQLVARERQADNHGKLTIGLALLALVLLILCSGCDSPNDAYGPDERAHVAAGHRVAGGDL